LPIRIYQRDRARLAERLKKLRESAGLSGSALARALGWPQSKISKIETMKQLPSADDITAWTERVGTPAGTADELVSLLDTARYEHTHWKDAFREVGAAGVQAEILAIESQADRIGEFQPSMMSGLLQTAEYARESLHIPSGPLAFGSSEDDIERTVAARMQRQQVLYDPSKRVQVVLLESALRVRLASVPTLRGQLDRLIAVAGLASLDLRIVPFESEVPVFPLSGFRIYDDNLVIVESISGEVEISDPEEVAKYVSFFELLREAGASGDDALRVISRSFDLLTDGNSENTRES
jgi:transcriptional regulator with XRE-family HTH domain